MSTFDGHVREFPDIRIDRFRHESGSRPALAYFLSHVHTDHLVGLDANRGIFVYCSSATREILLKLEKYPHRMNFAKGILESRKRTYEKLEKLLRPIPLETPTEIQLGYNRSIRVTLFDANHCTGSSMFLIEGERKAVLYTGDVRSESWWVNSLVRNPILIPYVASAKQPPLRSLDNIYLDTTFANKAAPYQDFPSKASGLMELLRKVSQFPSETMFYVDAWTFGYEEVWQALSAHLGSKIHVDRYRFKVYQSLLKAREAQCLDATKLNGARIGNDERKGGCLSLQSCRIHSCEKGTSCDIWSKRECDQSCIRKATSLTQAEFVRLTPIISRHNGIDMAELGAGGGHGDLNTQHELDLSDPMACSRLMQLCYSELKDQIQLRDRVFAILSLAMEHPAPTIPLELSDFGVGLQNRLHADDDLDNLPLIQAVHALAKRVTRLDQSIDSVTRPTEVGVLGSVLPQHITFPYSRHSSYTELCLLIEAFKPKDITPCTVDEQNWTANQSMGYLFGHIYEIPTVFTHDQSMLARHAEEADAESEPAATQYEQPSQTPLRESQQSNLKAESSPPTARISRRRPSHESPSNAARKKSPKRRRVSEGNYHVPIAKDYRSPPHTKDDYSPEPRIHNHCSPTPRREHDADDRDATKLLQTGAVDEAGLSSKSWRQPSIVEDRPTSPSRHLNRWQKHIAQARRQQSDPHPEMNEPALLRRSTEHGRPSPLLSDYAVLSREGPRSRHPPRESRRRRNSIDDGRLSPPALTPSEDSDPEIFEKRDESELRLALQWEAHDAVLGIGQDWSVMGLVSVQNHQTKEEEL